MNPKSHKHLDKPFYHSIFNGNDSVHYFHALQVDGTFDTFYREDDSGNFRKISSFVNKDLEHSILCASLHPSKSPKIPESAILGLMNGKVEQIMSLDSKRYWSSEVSNHRITEVQYSEDGSKFYWADENGLLGAFDEETKKPTLNAFHAHKSEIFFINEFKDLSMLVTMSMDSQQAMWDTRSMNKIYANFVHSPMRTAIARKDCRLFFSSFVKDSGLSCIDLRKVEADPVQAEHFKVAPFYLRAQALEFVSENTLACVFEDNSAKLIDTLTSEMTDWKIPEHLISGGKIMDFCIESAVKEVRICGDQFIESFALLA
jgi:hypothetical protein